MQREALPTKSNAARAICLPRWEGVTHPIRRDPCDGCALYQPCVAKCPVAPGAGPHIAWIEGINAAAARLGECEGAVNERNFSAGQPLGGMDTNPAQPAQGVGRRKLHGGNRGTRTPGARRQQNGVTAGRDPHDDSSRLVA